MKHLFKKIKSKIFDFFKQDVVYRHGTCYKLFYGRIYCIQKSNFIGDFYSIFETTDKDVYEIKVKEMIKNGIKFNL